MFILGCVLTKDSENNKNTYLNPHELRWGDETNSSSIILAIHGYNDYSKSFEIPANFLTKFNLFVIAFDLRGFGKNNSRGEWYTLERHINDIKNQITKLKKEYPKKKLYLMGESMGGAILFSLINSNKNLPIDGIILIAPAIWNFKKRNFFKSLTLNFFSTKIFIISAVLILLFLNLSVNDFFSFFLQYFFISDGIFLICSENSIINSFSSKSCINFFFSSHAITLPLLITAILSHKISASFR